METIFIIFCGTTTLFFGFILGCIYEKNKHNLFIIETTLRIKEYTEMIKKMNNGRN